MLSFIFSLIVLIVLSALIGAVLSLPLFLVYLLAKYLYSSLAKVSENVSANKASLRDKKIDICIDSILKRGRATFECIILDSPSGNTKHTEIDELIISPYGIFCIEYKAHRGIIFGSVNKSTWTQCKYDGKKPIHNHIRQNYKHVMAIKSLLGDKIKRPIESYVVYTNATDIHIDSDKAFLGVKAMDSEILKHNNVIYSIEDCRAILEVLVPAVELGRNLRQVHIAEVQEYLATLSV